MLQRAGVPALVQFLLTFILFTGAAAAYAGPISFEEAFAPFASEPPDPSAIAQRPIKAASLSDLVAANQHRRPHSEAIRCLANAIYFEARGEPLEGQLAVAQVILNRTEDQRFGDTACDVIREPAQFSFVKRGRIPQAPRSTPEWRRAVALAYIASEDLWDTPASNSLFFHARYVAPSWRHRLTLQARLGAHIFYN